MDPRRLPALPPRVRADTFPSRPSHPAGSAILLLLVLSSVVAILLGGMIYRSQAQQRASKARQVSQDFRQGMSALFLSLTSVKACGNALKGARFDQDSNDLSDDTRLRIPPDRVLRRTPGDSRLMGLRIEKVSLDRVERVGSFDGKEAWVARVVARTVNPEGIGANTRDFSLPLMVFAAGGRVESCNGSSGLLSYGIYHNPGSGGPARDARLAVRPASARAEAGGSAASVRCNAQEQLLAVNYTMFTPSVAQGSDFIRYESVFPLPLRNAPPVCEGANGCVQVDVESELPGCTALPRATAVECRILCGGVTS